MRIVSLTIPKPTLNNEDEIRSISLTIKSRNNGMHMIDSWPYAFPRYKYDLDDMLEISIYYKIKNSSSTNTGSSDEINLHSVVYFPCILLDEIDKKGKKQWILGLDRFHDNTSKLITDKSIDNALKEIKLMEEKARKSFKISKIYLIFYSCNNTVLNIEEQLSGSYINSQGLITQNKDQEKKLYGLVSKPFATDVAIDKSKHKNNVGILPDDSVSRISAKTSNSNTVSRTNLIKQNITENCDNLSDAIDMINKYRSRSKGSLTTIKSIDHGNNFNINNNNKKNTNNSTQIVNSTIKSSSYSRNINELDISKVKSQEELTITLSKLNEKDYGILNSVDTASIISKTISTNTQKYLEEKKELQERLFILQYYFSIWIQTTRKEKNIKKSKKNVKIMSGLINLLRVFENNQRFKKMMFIQALKFNSFRKNLLNKQFELEKISNEKNILAEKLNVIISDSSEKIQKMNENMLIKEKDVFELRKKLEYYDNINSELKEQTEIIQNENKRLLSQIKELNQYIEDKEKTMEAEKVKNGKEKLELEIIIDRRKKEYSRQLEEIHHLNTEISKLKNIINTEENKKVTLKVENEELKKKLLSLEEEKINIMNEFNQSFLAKSKENEELYIENIKYKEDNELLIKNNNRLADENNNYIKICEDLKNEKSSLIGSVYDLINQIENEKIERIQELENSRMLFQSINNRGGYNRKQIVNLCHTEIEEEEEEEDYEDLKLEDLKNTIKKGRKKENEIRRNKSDIVIGVNYIEIIGEKFDNNKLVKLGCIEIKGEEDIILKRMIREVRLEFYDDEYENIKLKNEQIMDLSERVKVLTDEMKKLKEREREIQEKDEKWEDNEKEESIHDEMEVNLDDTEKIIGSATEMFKLALRNIKINSQRFVRTENNNENENERQKMSKFGMEGDDIKGYDVKDNVSEILEKGFYNRDEKDDMKVNDDQMLMIVPSEFSFNSNYCNRNAESSLSLSSSSSSSTMLKKVNDEHLGNYHQYTIENNNINNSCNESNKTVANISESNTFGGNMFKAGYDKIVSSISSALTSATASTTPGSVLGSGSGSGSVSVSRSGSGSVSRLGSGKGSPMVIKGNEMSYSQMTKNNPIILQFPMMRSSSQSPAILSRSNSMRYSNNNNNNNNNNLNNNINMNNILSSSNSIIGVNKGKVISGGNNNNSNIGGYYYQYNTGEVIYKGIINSNNKNINSSNFIGEENSYQKRYSSIPRQNIKTVPPPFFPRN
ncbi:uncharacterized protein cubi_00764 [Cryptosporidium ubiquitum]|uniref:Uncharacterized protein n=1 Tax=Cryptosporidium ubiquitum TaxID=857276 RepID=A0A1J4MAX7_9CRYT|nr:uncharacterized protein cubi_00764 [Cryptosporidium ubiquitum]OII71386.1 hypothetical protein cubi_00764 [Cryptosporidium ubiquitum]